MVNNPIIETQPYEAQAQLLKVLTHPARLAILDILRDGEHCVCHMEAHLGFRQAYISQQLMVLKEAGLIQDRRDGWNVFYHISRTTHLCGSYGRGADHCARKQAIETSPSCFLLLSKVQCG